jgi:hypothetical protein
VTKPTSSGFDGGCRTPVRAPGNPERDHNLLLVELTRLSRVFRGGNF